MVVARRRTPPRSMLRHPASWGRMNSPPADSGMRTSPWSGPAGTFVATGLLLLRPCPDLPAAPALPLHPAAPGPVRPGQPQPCRSRGRDLRRRLHHGDGTARTASTSSAGGDGRIVGTRHPRSALPRHQRLVTEAPSRPAHAFHPVLRNGRFCALQRQGRYADRGVPGHPAGPRRPSRYARSALHQQQRRLDRFGPTATSTSRSGRRGVTWRSLGIGQSKTTRLSRCSIDVERSDKLRRHPGAHPIQAERTAETWALGRAHPAAELDTRPVT
jgi:hypothetical protein